MYLYRTPNFIAWRLQFHTSEYFKWWKYWLFRSIERDDQTCTLLTLCCCSRIVLLHESIISAKSRNLIAGVQTGLNNQLRVWHIFSSKEYSAKKQCELLMFPATYLSFIDTELDYKVYKLLDDKSSWSKETIARVSHKKSLVFWVQKH